MCARCVKLVLGMTVCVPWCVVNEMLQNGAIRVRRVPTSALQSAVIDAHTQRLHMRLQPLEYKLGHGLALAPAGLEECLQPFLVDSWPRSEARFVEIVRRSLAEHEIQRGNRGLVVVSSFSLGTCSPPSAARNFSHRSHFGENTSSMSDRFFTSALPDCSGAARAGRLCRNILSNILSCELGCW